MQRIDQYRIKLPKEGDMRIDAFIYADSRILVEDESVEQLRNAARIPGVVKALATPDIHSGYGVPIGAVVATRDIVIPAAVGYDVNCGMRVLTTPLKREDIDVKVLADSFRRDIPLGEGKTNIRLTKDDLFQVVTHGVRSLLDISSRNKDERPWLYIKTDDIKADLERIEENGSMKGDSASLSPRAISRGKDQLGTLGGGNHFIEIQVVESINDTLAARAFGLFENQIVIMIHSGSRGLGHQVGDDYMPFADEHSKGKAPVKHLGFFESDSSEGKRYIGAMHAAANFAFANRQVMAQLVRKNLRHYFGDIPIALVYDVPHNMSKLERHNGELLWVHRKGATRAFPAALMNNTPFENTGQPVLIPGSMGTASYILLGLPSAAETLYSVNHGAGRVMSRTAAAGKVRRRDGKVLKEGAISDERFRTSMSGIYLVCEDRATIKEEAPDAYKNIDVVIDNVVGAGLARIVARMRPLAVLKG